MPFQPALDNVTLAIWEQVQHSADLCVKCNICTSFCPVSNVTDLFPGDESRMGYYAVWNQSRSLREAEQVLLEQLAENGS